MPVVVGGHPLGQAPVEHHDLAERAEHHVPRLQVAVHHAAVVGEGDRLADRGERLEQLQPGEGVGLARARRRWSSAMASRRVRPHEPHRVKVGRPSSGLRPSSCTGTMFGCSSWPVISASRRKRRRTSWFSATSARIS
ncbi:MAG: hypothetical protein U0835_03445 [Isosphaeraceae bacterium]